MIAILVDRGVLHGDNTCKTNMDTGTPSDSLPPKNFVFKKVTYLTNVSGGCGHEGKSYPTQDSGELSEPK